MIQVMFFEIIGHSHPNIVNKFYIGVLRFILCGWSFPSGLQNRSILLFGFACHIKDVLRLLCFLLNWTYATAHMHFKLLLRALFWPTCPLHHGRTLQMEMSVIKDMVLGKPAPLVSTFRLSYYTILNLMSRVEGQFTAEHVIRNSFHQFQYEKVSFRTSYRCLSWYILSILAIINFSYPFFSGIARSGAKDYIIGKWSYLTWFFWRGMLFLFILVHYTFYSSIDTDSTDTCPCIDWSCRIS